MEPVCGMKDPFHYRNKAQYPIGTDREGNPIAGFYAGRTHKIIPNTVCALGKEINTEVLNIVLDFMKEFRITAYDEGTGTGLFRHVLIRSGFKTAKSWSPDCKRDQDSSCGDIDRTSGRHSGNDQYHDEYQL